MRLDIELWPETRFLNRNLELISSYSRVILQLWKMGFLKKVGDLGSFEILSYSPTLVGDLEGFLNLILNFYS